MKECIHNTIIWLFIFWAAQTFLVLRGYFRPRNENRLKPPLTEEQKAECARLEAELRGKEVKNIRWYATRPEEAMWFLGGAFGYLVLATLFLPMAICIWLLPDPNRS